MSSRKLTKRALKLLAFLLLSSTGVLLYTRWDNVPQVLSLTQLPPLYEHIRAEEGSLPHYEEYARDGKVKYFFANHVKRLGWGNVLQDFILTGLIAHATNRSFVFDDYVWDTRGMAYSEYNGKLIPSRIPLSALVGGPMVGGQWPPGDNTPLSVSEEFFHRVCPKPTVLRVSEVNTDEMRFDVSAAYVLEKWVEVINAIEDPCLMIDPADKQIFEFWMLGQKNRMLTIWPHLAKSPVATRLGWSPLIYDAYRSNRHLFEPTKAFNWFLGIWQESVSEVSVPKPIPGLLAIHVRRGDFEGHCEHLAKWGADWNAFNSFPEFVDKFDPPADAGDGSVSEESLQLYTRRCYPTIEQIVEKVRQVRTEAAGPPLRYLYVMTNGPAEWVEELKSALAQDMSWDRVSGSRDLKMTWEQKFVAQALDMYVAQRAQVLIGNGFSSMTSNVVMLRMALGFKPETNRFW